MPVTEALLEGLTPVDFRVLPDTNVLVPIYPEPYVRKAAKKHYWIPFQKKRIRKQDLSGL